VSQKEHVCGPRAVSMRKVHINHLKRRARVTVAQQQHKLKYLVPSKQDYW